MCTDLNHETNGEIAVGLRFLGGSSGKNGSPRLWETDEEYIWQGYPVEDTAVLAEIDVPDGEIVVRVPKSLVQYLPKDELNGVAD
ncbi:hypothetical protein [Nocardia callitridis]|uniref:Uncharacterized protein n=1 Tax=Nocardia callitridis TaxID=648753 RepID=A0ABP9JYM5_9NOCA